MNKKIRISTLIKNGLKLSKTLLFRALTYRATGFLKKPQLILELLEQATKKLFKYQSKAELQHDVVANFGTSFRLLRAYADGSYRQISPKTFAITVATLLYFVLPIDIIPDVIPMLGLLDDISLLVWLFNTFGEELDAFQVWESRGNPAIIEVEPPTSHHE